LTAAGQGVAWKIKEVFLLTEFKNVIKWFVPYGIFLYRKQLLNKKQISLLDQFTRKENEIRRYFQSLKTDDLEIIEIIDYFKKHRFSIFPYEFSRKYHASDIDVLYDNRTQTRYVMRGNKRLYFPEGWEIYNIRDYYNGLCLEQDDDSPHRYEVDGYIVQEGDVIADIGAAEGIWALDNADKAGKIYLFECNREWIKALKKTFEPWQEKVVITNKFVSNIDNKKNVTLDVFFKNKKLDFIKADIEGMEIKLLEGCKDLLANNSNLKLLLCAYHSKDDGTEINKILETYGYITEFSRRYMLFIYDKELEVPYIRRGLVRGKKA